MIHDIVIPLVGDLELASRYKLNMSCKLADILNLLLVLTYMCSVPAVRISTMSYTYVSASLLRAYQ